VYSFRNGRYPRLHQPVHQDSTKFVPSSCDGGKADTDSDSNKVPYCDGKCPQYRDEKARGLYGYRIVDRDSDSDNDGVLIAATDPSDEVEDNIEADYVPQYRTTFGKCCR
jgi:hypothetical protein